MGDIFATIHRFVHYPKEVLRKQHGKKVPLKDESDGRVIGEAELVFQEDTQVLEAHIRVDDPKMVEFLRDDRSYTRPSIWADTPNQE